MSFCEVTGGSGWSFFGKIQIGIPVSAPQVLFWFFFCYMKSKCLGTTILKPFLSLSSFHMGLVESVLLPQPHGEGEEKESILQQLSLSANSGDHNFSSCWWKDRRKEREDSVSSANSTSQGNGRGLGGHDSDGSLDLSWEGWDIQVDTLGSVTVVWRGRGVFLVWSPAL